MLFCFILLNFNWVLLENSHLLYIKVNLQSSLWVKAIRQHHIVLFQLLTASCSKVFGLWHARVMNSAMKEGFFFFIKRTCIGLKRQKCQELQKKLEFLRHTCVSPWTSQVAVIVYIHVCSDSYVAMTSDNVSNMNVAAKKLHSLIYTHTVSRWAPKISVTNSVSEQM